ncbi:MAG: hemin uptake protein HemP [Rhodobacteraceae bacterium]|nr:hemin uptake protein HemP [Paracoccaceae bacterium]
MSSSNVRREKLTISNRQAAQTGHTLPKASNTSDVILDTETLFKGARELKISHNSEIYRLSITKLGKLILTK